MQTLFLYTTSECHLCDQAKSLVAPVVNQLAIKMKEIEIADDDWLIENYGTRIPVIRIDGSSDELGWPFTPEDLIEYLTE